jgi:hypothetical protein
VNVLQTEPMAERGAAAVSEIRPINSALVCIPSFVLDPDFLLSRAS